MSTTPQLDPAIVKCAAAIIRQQKQELSKVAAEKAKLAGEVERLQRREECLEFAYKLAESGRIPADFLSIKEKAEKIASSDKSLAVIKEAYDYAQNDFDLGGVNESAPTTGGSLDPLTEVILSLG